MVADVQNSEMRMQFFPQRDRTTNQINEVHMNQLIAAFNNKSFGDMFVDMVEIKIKPFHRTYTMDNPTAGIYKGGIVPDTTTGQPKVYSSVSLTVLTKLVDGKEVPLNPMSVLESRANRLRATRIKDGSWREIDHVDDVTDPIKKAQQEAEKALLFADNDDTPPF